MRADLKRTANRSIILLLGSKDHTALTTPAGSHPVLLPVIQVALRATTRQTDIIYWHVTGNRATKQRRSNNPRRTKVEHLQRLRSRTIRTRGVMNQDSRDRLSLRTSAFERLKLQSIKHPFVVNKENGSSAAVPDVAWRPRHIDRILTVVLDTRMRSSHFLHQSPDTLPSPLFAHRLFRVHSMLMEDRGDTYMIDGFSIFRAPLFISWRVPSYVMRSTTFPVVQLINPVSVSRRTAEPTPCSFPISSFALHQTFAQLHVSKHKKEAAEEIFVLLESGGTRYFQMSVDLAVSPIVWRRLRVIPWSSAISLPVVDECRKVVKH